MFLSCIWFRFYLMIQRPHLQCRKFKRTSTNVPTLLMWARMNRNITYSCRYLVAWVASTLSGDVMWWLRIIYISHRSICMLSSHFINPRCRGSQPISSASYVVDAGYYIWLDCCDLWVDEWRLRNLHRLRLWVVIEGWQCHKSNTLEIHSTDWL